MQRIIDSKPPCRTERLPVEPMDEASVRQRIERHPVEGSVAQMRAAFAALADLPLRDDGLTLGREVLHGLDTLSVTPTGTESGDRAPLVHLHGGGFVFGSPDTHARFACLLARASGTTVHVPAYPLAPENPWPAQLDAMLAWLARLGADDGFFLSGDSAGGHLALNIALASLDTPRTRPHALVLFSPNTSRDYAASASRRAKTTLDAMNDPDSDDRLARFAFGRTRADDPAQNPLDRDLAALPPTFIDVGGDEILLDDSLRLARRAALAGVAIELHVAPARFHLCQLFAQHWAVADASLARAGRWLRARDRER